MKRVAEFLPSKNVLSVKGDQQLEIRTLVYNSKDVIEGSAFFALNGIHTDGHVYVADAVKSGAKAIIHSGELSHYENNVCYIQVENTRSALSEMSERFYDCPSKDITVIGITGTDGKSTTASFIHQLLLLEGAKAGMLSTVNINTDGKQQKNPYRQSTPEANHIQRILREMVDNGLEYAVIEATSHGLSEKTGRLSHVDFDVAVLTNITHEHLEFHGTHEQYRMDKANLFRNIATRAEKDATFAVINADDDWSELFMDASGPCPIFTYSTKSPEADCFSGSIHSDHYGTDFTLKTPEGEKPLRLNIPGSFNVENAMASLLVVSELLDRDILDVAEHIGKLTAVEGRMTRIDEGQPFHVIVDYAHTPGSFEKIFPSVKKNLKGRLISVFGSAGERDTEKRQEQGEIADQHSDFIILTDEDPRGENSMTILKDIAKGIQHKTEDINLFLIPDRMKAIEKAISLAHKEDLVLTLGKSHETTIIYADGPKEWNEIENVRKAVQKRLKSS